MAIAKSVTKSIDINTDTRKTFQFLSEPLNWTKWAVVNLKSISKKEDNWYEIETRQGRGQLKMLADSTYGILDHLWKDPQASWIVPARIMQNDTGCTFIMTFFKPSLMRNDFFKQGMKDIDIELTTLKKVLES
jgi:hypothetical protein